ncbi:MAG: hypothetical protein DMF64_05535 [Acidobacteria bacterium]|nr:MAG: hypothetical protein DMF64_05535 [Acidobacteriota bacterium]
MRKGIHLQVKLPVAPTPGAESTIVNELQQAFSATNPKLQLTVKDVAPDAKTGLLSVLAYIEGEQKATGDFKTMARGALSKAVNHMTAQPSAEFAALVAQPKKAVKRKATRKLAARSIAEVEHEDEDSGVVYPPPRFMPAAAVAAVPAPVAAPKAAKKAKAHALPADNPKPTPPANTFHGCPLQGKGGDPALNKRKNRIDKPKKFAAVALADIIGTKVPKSVVNKNRARWPAEGAKQVAQVEGLALQVEGWLTAGKVETPETCNCNSVNDLDYHLWLVDFPPTNPKADRAKAVVCEVSPRVRAKHPGWSFDQINHLIDGVTKVRLSGWLMLDQKHQTEVGKTRGTLWEIHPIINFEVLKGQEWLPLDKA